MSKHWVICFALLTVALTPQSVRAQDDLVVRVESQLVLVDVVVNGGTATSLSRDDFRIFDNGQEQQIAFFETVDGRTNLTGAVSLPARAATNRRDWRGATPSSATVILIDRVNTPTEAQVYVNQQVRDLVKAFDANQAIALYELRSDGLRIIHDFTSDPSKLSDRVARLEPEHSLALESSGRAGGFETELDKVGLDLQIAEIQTGNPGFNRGSADYFLNDRALRTSIALGVVARHIEGIRGRRNLVWLSGRFPFSFNVWSRSDFRESAEESTIRQIDDVATLMREANIAIYPVDVRGPGTGSDIEVAGIAQEIAGATGGRPFRTNAVSEAVQAALSDSRRIYTLGFYPSQPSKDRSRRSLRVEARDPSLNLLYRPHYTGVGGTDQPIALASMAELLSSPLDATGIGLTAMASPAEVGSGLELVTLVDIADLRLSERYGRWQGAINVGLVFRAEDDGTAFVIPPATSRITLSREQYETLKKTGLILQRFLNTEGRRGAVRIVVQDQATGSVGSVWVPVGTK